jgi:hypothetical protein
MWCFVTVCTFLIRAPLHRLQAQGYFGKPNLWASDHSMWYAALSLRHILQYYVYSLHRQHRSPPQRLLHYWHGVHALSWTCTHMNSTHNYSPNSVACRQCRFMSPIWQFRMHTLHNLETILCPSQVLIN